MPIAYKPNEHDQRLLEIFKQGRDSFGFDGMPEDPTLKGVIELARHVRDDVLKTIQSQLEKENPDISKKESQRLYMSGKGY